MKPITRRRILLVGLVAIAGCAATPWQRAAETNGKLLAVLNQASSPEMEKAIQDAQPGVPRRR